MNITDVRVRLIKRDDSKFRAVASIIIDDCFVIHDIKIIEGAEGNFIAMPSRKTPDGEYKDIAHPINTETRELIKDRILEAYDKTVAEAE
ncbi:MAG: septation regulator SpoVG [Eubacteriales bacterium]|nr:septation regulator SpoVG [Christensenellaceae bacterium]MDY3241896.1 septation regulator SpoVG [Eubacteriales bacterium]MCI7583507.1 septation regulator SpoVG [Christensenellaceae bacterium]MCI7769420.1 septation regulator SpoVG [Christensenellaceae bacterium]MDD6361115.1 septation regulator SpoVG [Christensenellaceae bacterium]